jgi:RecB family endonuclease NucS
VLDIAFFGVRLDWSGDLGEQPGLSKQGVEHELQAMLADRPAALAPGMSLSDAETVLEERGIGDASATLAALGYRVEWNGLAGGTLREK